MIRIECVDYQEGMAKLEDNSVDMIVTSPPYWQQRAYGFHSTLGFTSSPEEYIDQLRPFFSESFRVLKPTGGLWFNIGDARSQGGRRQRGRRDTNDATKGENFSGWSTWDGDLAYIKVQHDVPVKGFIGIPEMAMFAIMETGFRIRDKIIWAKGAMRYRGESYGGTTPSPHRDKFATSWEHVFYCTKSKYNYFNADRVEIPKSTSDGFKVPPNVWVIPPSAGREHFSYKDVVNFATYPPALTDICIGAGCPPSVCSVCGKPKPMLPVYKAFEECTCDAMLYRGLVLDPFAGSGTTGVSAFKAGVDCLMFDISPEQVEYAKARIKNVRNKQSV